MRYWGAAAVVISVAYLAIQIRRQTDQSRLVATREIAVQQNENLGLIIQDEKVAGLWLEAVQNYGKLPNVDRLRAGMLISRMVRLVEQQHLHIAKGHIDPMFFESMNRTYFELFTFPGVQAWWQGSKELFEEGFQKTIDEQISRAKIRGYASSFKEERENTGVPGAAADG